MSHTVFNPVLQKLSIYLSDSDSIDDVAIPQSTPLVDESTRASASSGLTSPEDVTSHRVFEVQVQNGM